MLTDPPTSTRGRNKEREQRHVIQNTPKVKQPALSSPLRRRTQSVAKQNKDLKTHNQQTMKKRTVGKATGALN